MFEFPGEDIARCHKVFEVGGAPILEQPQRLSHVCYRTEDGWTAGRDRLRRLRRGDRPATVLAGLDAKPLVYPLVGTIARDGTRTTY